MLGWPRKYPERERGGGCDTVDIYCYFTGVGSGDGYDRWVSVYGINKYFISFQRLKIRFVLKTSDFSEEVVIR
jgi:hypothetical protein